jgi:hypothetical protein
MAPNPTSDGGPCTPILWFVFPIGLMRLITLRYFYHFTQDDLCLVFYIFFISSSRFDKSIVSELLYVLWNSLTNLLTSFTLKNKVRIKHFWIRQKLSIKINITTIWLGTRIRSLSLFTFVFCGLFHFLCCPFSFFVFGRRFMMTLLWSWFIALSWRLCCPVMVYFCLPSISDLVLHLKTNQICSFPDICTEDPKLDFSYP